MGEKKNGSIIITAPAKLNLYLHILGRRHDGFHNVDSLVAFASISDYVEVRPGVDLRLTISGPFANELGPIEDNLVLRAARALQKIKRINNGANLILTKNLPVAAGIGGGSSNAAATLLALVRLWNLNCSYEELNSIALTLGADVPVCLYGRAAFMRGIGESITSGPVLPPANLVIVNPRVRVSTPAVFKACRGPFSRPVSEPVEFDGVADLANQLAYNFNDLTQPAILIEPVIKAVLAALESVDDCLLFRMSGSGGSCFGVFEKECQAAKAAADIENRYPDWWIKTAKLMGREPRLAEYF